MRAIFAKDFFKLQECKARCKKEFAILVDVSRQRLHWCHAGQEQILSTYPISTASNGVGQEEGSGQTPLGLHEIVEKIGEGADPLAIFKSRIATGQNAAWNAGDGAITARILRLQGKEIGYNLGKREDGICVDSYERFIYIHGTNDIAQIGKPISQGCIRMIPQDLIDLFSVIPLHTPVLIYV